MFKNKNCENCRYSKLMLYRGEEVVVDGKNVGVGVNTTLVCNSEEGLQNVELDDVCEMFEKRGKIPVQHCYVGFLPEEILHFLGIEHF